MSQPGAAEQPSGLVPYTHPGGMRLLVPAGWELSEDARPGLVLVAVEPEPRFRMGSGQGSGFRANLVVTCEELPEGLDLATWQAATAEMLPSTVDDYAPVRAGEVDLAGMPTVHRVGQHRSKAGANVTMAQWAAVLPGPDRLEPHRLGRDPGVPAPGRAARRGGRQLAATRPPAQRARRLDGARRRLRSRSRAPAAARGRRR